MKSSIDLLSLDLVFSQQELVSPSGFEQALAPRFASLLLLFPYLDALHAAGFLTPLYREDIDDRDRSRTIVTTSSDPDPQTTLRLRPNPQRLWLRRALDESRLHDPRHETFQTWLSYQRKVGGLREPTSQYWYSPYHLLLLPELRELVRALQPQPLDRSTSDVTERTFTLELSDRNRQRFLPLAHLVDELAVALSALEPVYRPRVYGYAVSHSDEEEEAWRQLDVTFDPLAMVEWLEWTADHVREVAEQLLQRAGRFDPLGEWQSLVRLTRPEKWGDLRGDALVAMDYRIAAKMLFHFYEDLARRGMASPLPEIPDRFRHQFRVPISIARTELDEVLMDYGVSPYPSLLMSLEGDTEMLIVPKVMELLNIKPRGDFIEFLDAEGAKTKFGLLATHVVSPRLGMTIQEMVLLKRPLTRLLIVRDPEGSPELGWEERETTAILKQLRRALPREHQTSAMEEQLASLVFFDGWGIHSFEFAHFDDSEIARAILAIYRGEGAPGLEELAADVASQRIVNGNLKSVWSRWKPKPSKVALAEALWPALKARIEAGLVDGSAQFIPIVRIVRRAQSLANEFRRADIGMRK